MCGKTIDCQCGGTEAVRKFTPCPCPKCNHKVLIDKIKIKTTSDFAGAVCQNCGYTVTYDDVIAQATKIIQGWQGTVQSRK
jgi:transcription elongation factor Elf1